METGLAGIPTAFKGTFGTGGPVVAILGEFDALPGLSQKPGRDTQEKREETDCGHGCGHNLLGTGSLAAAVAVKAYLEESGGAGTIVYFGCPGEEKGSGKTFMAREGCFEGLDAVFCWHPWDVNGLFHPVRWQISAPLLLSMVRHPTPPRLPIWEGVPWTQWSL